MTKQVYIETLGCAKNQVDSEIMSGLLTNAGYTMTAAPENAQIIIINTCAFIGDAKEESVNVIFELMPFRTEDIGLCTQLIVAGCLSQRYAEELLKEIPEVDTFIGTTSFDRVVDIVDNNLKGVHVDDISKDFSESLPRITSPPKHYAYLKISEGCDNKCTYCIIPSLRGKYRSRSIEDIVNEAKALVNDGVRELVVIAQDTTFYGKDLYGDFKLGDLIRELNKIKNLKWIRLQYCYPDSLNDDMIEAIADCEKVVKYMDIPIQHGSDRVLKLMNRNTDKKKIMDIFQKLRSKVPGIMIRSTVIVGFPGERDEDFEELMDLAGLLKIDRLGAFKYSPEEGTAAVRLPNHVLPHIAEERHNRLMELQMGISSERMGSFIGQEVECVIEEIVEGEAVFIGRTSFDTPDVDGIIYVHTDKDLSIGEFVNVKITDAMEYDLIGEL